MHEMSLTEGVVRILEDHAASHGFTKVKTVWLEIGELSQVDPEAMAFCFDAVTRGSPIAAGAVLEIIRVPGEGFCLDCAKTVKLASRVEGCPECGGFGISVTQGGDMRVKELEVE
jgi:hydrogenase nickel incorporation protein HypA/HybF